MRALGRVQPLTRHGIDEVEVVRLGRNELNNGLAIAWNRLVNVDAAGRIRCDDPAETFQTGLGKLIVYFGEGRFCQLSGRAFERDVFGGSSVDTRGGCPFPARRREVKASAGKDRIGNGLEDSWLAGGFRRVASQPGDGYEANGGYREQPWQAEVPSAVVHLAPHPKHTPCPKCRTLCRSRGLRNRSSSECMGKHSLRIWSSIHSGRDF